MNVTKGTVTRPGSRWGRGRGEYYYHSFSTTGGLHTRLIIKLTLSFFSPTQIAHSLSIEQSTASCSSHFSFSFSPCPMRLRTHDTLIVWFIYLPLCFCTFDTEVIPCHAAHPKSRRTLTLTCSPFPVRINELQLQPRRHGICISAASATILVPCEDPDPDKGPPVWMTPLLLAQRETMARPFRFQLQLDLQAWIGYQNTVPSGLGQDPVWAPEHEVNIIQLESGIETTIIFNSRTENPIIRSWLGQMGRQRRPLPFLSKSICWLEPQRWWGRYTMVGEGRRAARFALVFCIMVRCLVKSELGPAAPSPPHSTDTTIKPAGSAWNPSTATAGRWSDRWTHPMRTTSLRGYTDLMRYVLGIGRNQTKYGAHSTKMVQKYITKRRSVSFYQRQC